MENRYWLVLNEATRVFKTRSNRSKMFYFYLFILFAYKISCPLYTPTRHTMITGKIYIIKSPNTEKVYIGSTIKNIQCRLRQHLSDYTRYKNNKYQYITSFDILEHEGAYIELLLDYPCNDKYELYKKEGELIRETENTVNRCVAGRTYAEYYADNVETIKQRSRDYYKDNVERIKAERNQKNICPCGGRYTKRNRARHNKTKRHINYIENTQH